MQRSARQYRDDGITVDIGIVGHQPRRGNRQRGVLVDGIAVIPRHRRVIDLRDDKVDRGGSRGQRTIADSVGETVCAGVVGVRRVDKRSIRR